ncbi:unnamed protein product [Prorocentrum cordatum]|uniref:Uncharacterized protein n=1 Tax=Prorocentrum cordatum TaxID=2364126 RepID=A0ABN9QIW6_9DINO|nr:unnamed protein product [Polarella glacialis]
MPTITEGVACISRTHVSNISTDWVTLTSLRDGRRWVTCDRSCAGFCKYVKNSSEMLEHLQELRTFQCDRLMADSAQASTDPFQDTSTEGSSPENPLKRAKKSMADDIAGNLMRLPRSLRPGWITLNVECEGGTTRSVNVLSAPYGRTKLTIERADESLAVLLMKPRRVGFPNALVPEIARPYVKWLGSQQTCRVKYFNGALQKWSCKTKRAPMVGSPAGFQRGVDAAAAELQEFRDVNHVERRDVEGERDGA